MCRKKERLHRRYKRTKNDTDYAKFSKCRKEFKNLVKQKMQDNFDDDNDPNRITKKFWSYVKSKSSSHRIPELMSYNGRLRTNRSAQCELFNEFFYRQFSDPSLYNIDIDYSNDALFHINFSPNRIGNLLCSINPNRAQGPDMIHGRILKNCANALSYPLSFLFSLSYRTGCIPQEWKLAHVVPIHKKGSKSEVENYRPISLTSIIMKTYERKRPRHTRYLQIELD